MALHCTAVALAEGMQGAQWPQALSCRLACSTLGLVEDNSNGFACFATTHYSICRSCLWQHATYIQLSDQGSVAG